MIAESYVYEDENGKGYVGRRLPDGVGSVRLICPPGGVLPDERVEALGLKNLKDRNKYDEGAK